MTQALPVSLTTKITARTSEAPSQPGAVPLGSNYLSTTASQSTLQETQKNPRDEPGRSHLKSPTSSWKIHEVTHHNKSVSFISSLKLVNLHTAHNKDQRGEAENQYPWSLSTGVCALLCSRQELSSKHHWLARSVMWLVRIIFVSMVTAQAEVIKRKQWPVVWKTMLTGQRINISMIFRWTTLG